jgi:glucose-1-phosphate thymidylyltransferase
MKCIITAAGYGTRLYPLTENQAKPLLQVKGKPIINYVVEKADKIKEVDSIYIVSNNKFYTNFSWWLSTNEKNFKKPIEIIDTGSTNPENALGAIHDGLMAVEKFNIDEDIIFLYPDIIFSLDINDFVSFFKEKQTSCLACYELKDKEQAKRMGIIETDSENKMIGVEEKPKEPKSNLAVAGMYILKKEDLSKLKEFLKKSEKEGKLDAGFGLTYFIIDLYKKQPVFAFPFSGEWIDIGTIEDYEKLK